MERWVCLLSCPFGVHHEVTDTSKTEASAMHRPKQRMFNVLLDKRRD